MNTVSSHRDMMLVLQKIDDNSRFIHNTRSMQNVNKSTTKAMVIANTKNLRVIKRIEFNEPLQQ